MSDTIDILIVDDHPVVRDGLVAILETQADFAVAGLASGGAEAVKLAAELQPDVIMLDLEMPDMDGVATLEALREADLEVRVIVFTVFDTDDRILSAVQAGAQGYLLKSAPRDELFAAIRVVNEGGSLLQPVVASKLLGRMRSGSSGGVALSKRELEVLQVLAKGLQNKEIADQLSIAERTVKFHVSAILRKLGAGNRNRGGVHSVATRHYQSVMPRIGHSNSKTSGGHRT